MSRTIHALLCALCLCAFGLAAVPASAQPGPGPGTGPVPADSLSLTLPMIRMVKVTGGGETATEALENALEKLEEDYVILRYTVIDSECIEALVPPMYDEDDDGIPDEPEVEVGCWAEVRALVLIKAALTS